MADSAISVDDRAEPAARTGKRGLYLALNAMMITLVLVASLLNGDPEFGRSVYVIILFAVCTSPLLFLRSLMGKELLLLLYLAVYLTTFSLMDICSLILQIPVPEYPRDFLFTKGEIGIILGAACLLAGYALAVALMPKHSPGILRRDWSPKITTFIGIALWAIGFYFMGRLQFGASDVFAKVSYDPRIEGFFTMFRMMQPLGTLVLIYRFLITRSKVILILLLMTMAADAALGFIGDIKQVAVQGPLLYLICVAALRQRLPIKETIIFVLFIGIVFNFSNQYRNMLHADAMTRTKALANIGSVAKQLERTNKDVGKGFTVGINAFLERITLKYYFEMVVAQTGEKVAFQNGNTIEPLLFAFIPRFVLPDKPDNVISGKLFNAAFNITGSKSTYVAVGQLGELYWNFGWTGLTVGMILIGGFLACFSSLVDLETNPTLPRFLLLLCAVFVVALRFESGIAQTYTVWARVTVMLLLLNAFIPKKPDSSAIQT